MDKSYNGYAKYRQYPRFADQVGRGLRETNYALYCAALFDRHVAWLKSTANLTLYAIGFEDMPAAIVNDASPYPGEWSAARWIAGLASSHGAPVWGENRGRNSADL